MLDLSRLRRYYAGLTDESLLSVVNEGQQSFEPDAWQALLSEVSQRGLTVKAAGHTSDERAELEGSIALPQATSAATTPPVGDTPSPLSTASLFALYFRPRQFFAKPSALAKTPEVAIVAWIGGIAYAFGRIDKALMRAELGAPQSGRSAYGEWLTESWWLFWGFAVAIGAVNALIFWYVGGWWYRKRLEWSGAKGVTAELVRPVYMYQDLVVSAPALVGTALQTLIYSSYAEAWAADEYWSVLLLVFPFWSCVTSYLAATTAFQPSRSKARVWFLVLPITVYVLALGLVGTLYAMLGT